MMINKKKGIISPFVKRSLMYQGPTYLFYYFEIYLGPVLGSVFVVVPDSLLPVSKILFRLSAL